VQVRLPALGVFLCSVITWFIRYLMDGRHRDKEGSA